MSDYAPPVFALECSLPSPGLFHPEMDTIIAEEMLVEDVPTASPFEKLQDLTNAPSPSTPPNLASSSGRPSKRNNDERTRSSISKGTTRPNMRFTKHKPYQKLYGNRTPSRHVQSRQSKLKSTSAIGSSHTPIPTPPPADDQSNGRASGVEFPLTRPGTPIDPSLELTNFDLAGIDVDELFAAFDAADIPLDDFDLCFDLIGVPDHASHVTPGQDIGEGEVFANAREFDLGYFDYEAMLDPSTLEIDNQPSMSSYTDIKDQQDDPTPVSSIDVILTIGSGASSIESSVKGLYYPGSNVFVPIDLDVF